MRAVGDDSSIVEDEDSLGAADGAEAVGDDDGGLAGEKFVEGLLDLLFALGVEGGGGFVEDQDRSVAEEGAGEGDALFLTAGEAGAFLADDGLVAVVEIDDELVGKGVAGGFFDLLAGGIETANANVLDDGVVEEDRILRDQRDRVVESFLFDLTDVASVDPKSAPLDVVETADEVGEGRFSGATGADEGDDLAAFDGQVHILQGRRLVVAKGDVVELDGSYVNVERFGIFRFGNLNRGVEDILDALEGGSGLANAVVDHAELFHGLVGHIERENEGDDLFQSHPTPSREVDGNRDAYR